MASAEMVGAELGPTLDVDLLGEAHPLGCPLTLRLHFL